MAKRSTVDLDADDEEEESRKPHSFSFVTVKTHTKLLSQLFHHRGCHLHRFVTTTGKSSPPFLTPTEPPNHPPSCLAVEPHNQPIAETSCRHRRRVLPLNYRRKLNCAGPGRVIHLKHGKMARKIGSHKRNVGDEFWASDGMVFSLWKGF
nr:hypothetical protein [Tanacetum cinerariifolium]